MENELVAQSKVTRQGTITLNKHALEHMDIEMGDFVTVRKGPSNTIILKGAMLVEKQ